MCERLGLISREGNIQYCMVYAWIGVAPKSSESTVEKCQKLEATPQGEYGSVES